MKLSYLNKGFLGLALVMGLYACDGEKQAKTPAAEKIATSVKQPKTRKIQFNADSAYAFVEKQVAFGPRDPNSPGRQACAEWLVQKLKTYTPNVSVQEFQARGYDSKVYTGQNIIASFNPGKRKRIMLSAHYDTRPFADQDDNMEVNRKPIDGANDGGSGVGVILEIARMMKEEAPEIGVDIFLWDLEDFGAPDWHGPTEDDGGWALGSKYWSANPHELNYRAQYGILLDMVGGKGNVFAVEGYSMEYAPAETEMIWNVAAQMGHDDIFRPYTGMTVMDDHVPINTIAGIPTVDILGQDTSSGYYKFNQHWHTHGDNMEDISKDLLNVCGRVVEKVIYSER